MLALLVVFSSIGAEQASLNGPHTDLSPTSQSEAAQDTLDVVGHGTWCEHEPLGDLLIRQPFSNARGDFLLAARKLRQLVAGFSPPLTASVTCQFLRQFCSVRQHPNPTRNRTQEAQIAV